jgi:hypothetical protein
VTVGDCDVISEEDAVPVPVVEGVLVEVDDPV